jgi:hypothetical protein
VRREQQSESSEETGERLREHDLERELRSDLELEAAEAAIPAKLAQFFGVEMVMLRYVMGP